MQSTHFNTADDMVWFQVSWLNDPTSADETVRKLSENLFYSLWFSKFILKWGQIKNREPKIIPSLRMWSVVTGLFVKSLNVAHIAQISWLIV